MPEEQLGEEMVGISHSCPVQVSPFSYVSREEGEVMVGIPHSWHVQVTPFSFVTGVEWEVEL